MKLLHNKKLKNVLFALSIFCTTQVFSQQVPDSLSTPRKRATILTTQMTSQLKLSHYQIPKVDSLNLVYAEIIEVNVIKSDRNKLSKYFEMQRIMDKKDVVLETYLNKAQFEAYKKMRSKAMNNIVKNAF